MNPRVFVEVSDKYLWALKPFAYLFNIYWSELQPVVVFGYSRPDFRLPNNFNFYSISGMNYPAEKWSNGFIHFLKSVNDTHFVLMLVDYWLCRSVDVRGVAACMDYVANRHNVLRCDLTGDRLYAGGMYDVDYWGCYDIIETPPSTPYQFSLQTAIWNKQLMLDLVVQDKTPWEVELHTQVPDNYRVIGTRQWPVRYANAILKGKLDLHQIEMIPSDHRYHVFNMLPNDLRERGNI